MTGDRSRHFFDRPISKLELGLLSVQQEKYDTAWNLAKQIFQDHPDDNQSRSIARRILAKSVDQFHPPMLRDAARNKLYNDAIGRAAPGKVVLDIGTGSGLLAMMAARAGAKHVIACEENYMLAHTAREIVAANGLQDKISVYNLRSTQLDRHEHLVGGADLVVSEIFSHDLVGEGVLPSLEHARAELCKTGARFLPPQASVRVALAQYVSGYEAIGEVVGFDLSKFDQVSNPYELVHLDCEAITLRSNPIDLFEFDFAADKELIFDRDTAVSLKATGGSADGIAQWLRIDFGDGLVYENAPGSSHDMHWPIQFVPFSTTRMTSPEEPIPISASHTRNLLMLWEDL